MTFVIQTIIGLGLASLHFTKIANLHKNLESILVFDKKLLITVTLNLVKIFLKLVTLIVRSDIQNMQPHSFAFYVFKRTPSR